MDDSRENLADASVYNPDYLRKQARWIRDYLDPQVARDGPDTLHSDDVLKLDEFLRRLLASNVSLDDLRYSRIHSAVVEMAGRATRWPKRLIERCEALEKAWGDQYGPMRGLKTPLYEPGGRLHGICRPEDLDREKMIFRWSKGAGTKAQPAAARRAGHLSFKPGDWWIHPVFAFRDGIIDSPDKDGSITCDAAAAYAVLMTDKDEIPGPNPDIFTYRAKDQGRGRYRLAACTRDSRIPVRILRSHSLQGFWSPRAGIRYDGLHKVTGFTITRDKLTKSMLYEVHFKKVATDTDTNDRDLKALLMRPWAEEVEDYKEYKRLRTLARDTERAALDASVETGVALTATDGSAETCWTLVELGLGRNSHHSVGGPPVALSIPLNCQRKSSTVQQQRDSAVS